MSKKELFFQDVKQLLDAGTAFKMILSKPRPGVELRSAIISLMDEEGELKFKQVEKTDTQHFTTIIPYSDFLNHIKQVMDERFYYCELFNENGNAALLQNQKGTVTYLKRKGGTAVKSESHDREKAYLIPEEADFLQKLGISSSQGRVFEQSTKKFRQINKYAEIIDSLVDKHRKQLTIADMGSGKAYLTFALYYHLKHNRGIDVVMTGYELRPELVNLCNQYARELGYDKLNFIQANIEEIVLEKTDMVVSLHACDIATDMAIHAGLKAQADYIVLAPCCHKQIRKQIELRNGILKHGILLERQAEIITDAIRALVLEDKGYKTQVFEFISTEHTAKNTMIIAKKARANEHAALEIRDIKETYGIRYHYLEKLLDVKY
jgi:hypothetical protein